MFDLISKSQHIHHLSVTVKELDSELNSEDVHQSFQCLESKTSIVKFNLSADLSEISIGLVNYERIANCLSKNHVINEATLLLEYDDDETSLALAAATENVLSRCSNLDKVEINGHCQYRPGNETDLKCLIRLARTFAAGMLTQESRLPRELFATILYEGFKDLGWHDDQLSVVIRALSNRRTAGSVRGDVLPLSRSYLYVRCRDALERLRTSE